MSCSSLMFSLFFLSPCDRSGGTEISEAVAAAVANPQPPTEDIARASNRKPAEVLSFFDIEPGLTVLDLFSDSGCYTKLLNPVVGSDGLEIAHSNEAGILCNSGDDHALSVFDPSIRGQSDRFVFRFVRN